MYGLGRTNCIKYCGCSRYLKKIVLIIWNKSINNCLITFSGNLETVRQLLDRGLDETHRDNAGWTPLHYAAFEGYADICVQLVDSGAKIDECDNEGKTALHLSAQEGRDKVIEALLTIHNICVDLRAHDGKSAFRLACIEGCYNNKITC